METFLKDLRHSLRMFRQAPAFTIAAIAALALGIGTKTAIFSVVNTVFLRPLAFTDPERIVMFQNAFRGGSGGSTADTLRAVNGAYALLRELVGFPPTLFEFGATISCRNEQDPLFKVYYADRLSP